MKKALTLLLVFALVFSLCGLVACDKNDGDGDSTSGGTNESDKATGGESSGNTTTAPETKDDETTPEETEDDGPEPNSFPYEVEDESMMPLSIVMGQTSLDYTGAPTADAQYFVIDEDHIIHDGKGTYQNSMATIGTAVFDRDKTTFYDCDENCNYVNTTDADYGIVLEDWNCEDTASAIEADNSGYVGAYFEDGIKLIQIRYLARSGMVKRIENSIFQASTDGKEWVEIGTIEPGDVIDGYFSDINVSEEYADTVFHYVRMLAKPHDTLDDPTSTGDWSYCNVAEIEFWGTPAA